MKKAIKSTKYCNLLAQGTTQEGPDISAVEKIFIKDRQREEIRFAEYKEKEGVRQFQLKPLDLSETELLDLFKAGLNNDVFSDAFRENLKTVL